jgi:Tol biopolymer transport system component
LNLANRSSSLQAQLAPDLSGFFDVTWSPDGKWIAFIASSSPQSPPNACALLVDGDSLNDLSNSNYGGISAVAWSPDGNRVFYESQKDSGGHGNIFISSRDGSVQYRLIGSDR